MIWPFSTKQTKQIKTRKPRAGSIRIFQTDSDIKTASLRSLLSSPNTDIHRSLVKTRNLSRYMCDNDSYAAKYLELTSVYVTGDDGIQCHPIITKNGKQTKPLLAASKELGKAWKKWGEVASADGKFSWSELEQMGIQTVARDGEALFRIVVGRGVNDYAIALQPLDVALLDQEYHQSLPNGNTIVMGIELDRFNRPVSYHIWNRYLDDRKVGIQRKRERIPAEEILHIYDDPTGVQIRSLPWTTPALDQLVRLMEWQDDYSAGLKLAARTRLVVHEEDTPEDELEDNIEDDIVDGATRTVRYTDRDDNQEIINPTQAGIIQMPYGKKLEALDIGLPASGVAESAKLILQRIAAGLNVSYATLTSDGSKSSFSSVRHDSIVERDIWKQRQKWYIRRFHNKVFGLWLRSAVLSGKVVLPDDIQISDVSVEWLPRGFAQIDAVKEIKAYTMAIEQGIFSRSQVAALAGNDYVETVNQIAEDRAYAESLGVIFPEVAKTIEAEAAKETVQEPEK